MKLNYYINELLKADFTCESWHSSEKLEAWVLNLCPDMFEFLFQGSLAKIAPI